MDNLLVGDVLLVTSGPGVTDAFERFWKAAKQHCGQLPVFEFDTKLHAFLHLELVSTEEVNNVLVGTAAEHVELIESLTCSLDTDALVVFGQTLPSFVRGLGVNNIVLFRLDNIVEDAHTSTGVLPEVSGSSSVAHRWGFGDVVLLKADCETLEFKIALHLVGEGKEVILSQEVFIAELNWFVRCLRVRHGVLVGVIDC